MDRTKPLFSAKDIGCSRRGRILFQNVRFSLMGGQCLHIQGINGAGKTTLLEIMAGLIPPEEGVIETTAPTAYLPAHDNALKSHETVEETLTFWAHILKADAIALAMTATGITALAATPVRALSTGQKRRLNLARMMMDTKASLWLLDEPFNGLDDDGAALLKHAIEQHCAAGKTIAIAAHTPLPVLQGVHIEVLRLGAAA